MIGRLLLSTTTTLLFIYAAQGAEEPLPIPFPELSGPYAVGEVDLVLTDNAREEVFTDTTGDLRRLLVTLYYPAIAPGIGETRAYGADGRSEFLRGYPTVAAMNASTTWDAPAHEGTYPLIIFSPGFGNVTAFYSSLLSELASQGYVVAAIWHTYSTSKTPFPGEEVVLASEAGVFDDSSEDAFKESREGIGAVWVADIRFVVDEMIRWNDSDSIITGLLDLDHIGAIGHSFGGAAGVQASIEDSRFDAFINMDGDMFGEVLSSGPRVPFLFIKSDPPMPSDERLAEMKMAKNDFEAQEQERIDALQVLLAKRTDISFMQTLTGGVHNAFMTDYLFFSPTLGPQEVQARLIGNVDPPVAFKQISGWVSEFFKKHLNQ